MALCLVPESGDVIEVDLLPDFNRSGDVWHVTIEAPLQWNTLLYGWKADGEYGWEGMHS